MHHKKLFISYIVLSSVISGFADNARFHVQVLDSVTSEPVPNISVRGTFTSKFPRWKNATEYSGFSAVTGSDGKLFFSGKTNCGRAGFRTEKNSHYYGIPWFRVPFENKGTLPFSWWQPDNLVVTIKLQRVEHPISLFVKNFFKDGNDYVDVDYFGKGGGKMQLDLIKGDWLPPLGNGEISDVVFTRLEREDLGIGTNFNGRTAAAYRDGISVKFLGIDNGLVEIPFEKTSGIMIRTALEDGYKSDYLVTKGKDKKVKYFSSSNPDRNFAFRIRTKRDKDGRIISAYYGKIYGDIEIKKFSYGLKVPVATPAFLYYLNPTPLDRNLEWDMKTNLCPNPGSLVQKQP